MKKIFYLIVLICFFTFVSSVSAYTEVEYLESTGTQYIETNYTPNINTILEFTVSNIDTFNNQKYSVLYSASNEWDFNIFAMTYQTRNMHYGFRRMFPHTSTNDLTFGNGTNLDVNTIRINFKGETYFNGIKVLEEGTSTTPSHLDTLHICGENRYNDSGQIVNKFRTHSFKIYENDVLIKDFIPVLDESNVPCLYDKVTSQYYYNVGSGSFSYGSVIDPVINSSIPSVEIPDTDFYLFYDFAAISNFDIFSDYDFSSFSDYEKVTITIIVNIFYLGFIGFCIYILAKGLYKMVSWVFR